MNRTLQRIGSWLCVLALCISLMPTTVLAADEQNIFTTKEAAEASGTNVTANKAVSGPDADGNYTITLSVKGTTSTSTSCLLYTSADCKVKHLKLQRRLFRDDSREWTREEYGRLIAAAENTGKERLSLLMEGTCATGIRVSEVKHLTVEAAQAGKAEISLKGKIRTILIPAKLCRKLF